MGTGMRDCPVCETRDAGVYCKDHLPKGGDAVAGGESRLIVECAQCGNFTMSEGFHRIEWSTVSAEERKAIAASLKATKVNPGARRILDSRHSCNALIRSGKALL